MCVHVGIQGFACVDMHRGQRATSDAVPQVPHWSAGLHLLNARVARATIRPHLAFFLSGSHALNSNPHAFLTSTLLIEPASQSLFYFE